MSKVVTVQLKWEYTPNTYIEDPINISEDQYELSISEGVALAKIEPSLFKQEQNIKERLTELIESRFQAVQIMSHAEYALSGPSRTEIMEDGKRKVFIEAHATAMILTAYPADITHRDKDGKVISDTKAERLAKQKWFAETVNAHRKHDKTLDQILRSYHAAVGDPDNEFVHLYEVREALEREFGGYKNAIKKLGITKGERDIIGKLANIEPLKQGRHRGRSSAGMLRDAGKNELEAARKSVAKLIEKYLVHLENK